MYYPDAFSPGSLSVLRETFPGAVEVTKADADVFGLNAFSDGCNVVLPQAAVGLVETLKGRGLNPVGVDVAELLKAGGSVKCCTLELRQGRS